MSLFEKLFRKNRLAEEKIPEKLEEDNSGNEIFDEEDEELSEDGMYGEEEGEDGQEPAKPEEDPDTEYEIVEREILPAKIICPDCGGITLEGLDFCDKCGGELH